MKLRKIMLLFLVFALCLSVCISVFAVSSADDAFMSDLKKVENYLKKNLDETNLGDKTIAYMKKNCSTMDVERLTRVLRSFLRCADTVPLRIMLESYGKEISSDYYLSIYESAIAQGTSPDVAADQTRFERGWLGSKIGATNPSATPDPKICPVYPPCYYCR